MVYVYPLLIYILDEGLPESWKSRETFWFSSVRNVIMVLTQNVDKIYIVFIMMLSNIISFN